MPLVFNSNTIPEELGKLKYGTDDVKKVVYKGNTV